jgi:hypothetical protein
MDVSSATQNSAPVSTLLEAPQQRQQTQQSQPQQAEPAEASSTQQASPQNDGRVGSRVDLFV